MNGQPQVPQEPKEMDVKAELKRHKISLHNTRLQVQILETLVTKFTELAR